MADDDMLNTFNCGVGMVVAMPADETLTALDFARAGGPRGLGRRARSSRAATATRCATAAFEPAGAVRPVDLIGCGALNLDLIYRLPEDAALWDSCRRRAPSSARGRGAGAVDAALAEADVEPTWSGGGQAANTGFALAKLGFASAMLGRIGNDDEGEFAARELAPAKRRYLARGGETGRVYVLLNETGERRNLVYPAANDEFSPADLPRRLPRTRYAYFSSFVGEGPLEAQLALLERLPARGRDRLRPGRDLRAPRRQALHPSAAAHRAAVRDRERAGDLLRPADRPGDRVPAQGRRAASWCARWASRERASSASGSTSTSRRIRPRSST